MNKKSYFLIGGEMSVMRTQVWSFLIKGEMNISF